MSRSRWGLRVLAGLIALALSGCHGYLLPYDERPLPAQSVLETNSGQRLAIAGDGQLIARPGRGDVAAALGVALFDAPEGVFVANALVAGSALRRGDRIQWVVAALPKGGRELHLRHEALANWTEEEADGSQSSFDNYQQLDLASFPSKLSLKGSMSFGRGGGALKPGPSPTLTQFRGQAGAHAVTKAADLRGYLAGAGWLKLDFLIERAGQDLVIRVPLERRESWVPTRPRLPDRGRWRGLELVPVATLPANLQPRSALPGDVLVTRVARSSPLGEAGLRPLDLITSFDADMLLGGTASGDSLGQRLRDKGHVAIEARAPDGRLKAVEFQPRQEPTQLWFPFAFAYERGSGGYHFGLGWWDVLFHASGRTEYSPDLDDYVETSRWSFMTVLSGGESRTEEGTVWHAGLNLILDPVRLDYFQEWFETPSKVRSERGLEGY
ncbi:MAG: hypothetical protein JKY65_12210 [Planctomycetes bacterium]|nr:hypothetical protein [Planctomycetota bacterium]